VEDATYIIGSSDPTEVLQHCPRFFTWDRVALLVSISMYKKLTLKYECVKDIWNDSNRKLNSTAAIPHLYSNQGQTTQR
jgi:hypothetical protein